MKIEDLLIESKFIIQLKPKMTGEKVINSKKKILLSGLQNKYVKLNVYYILYFA